MLRAFPAPGREFDIGVVASAVTTMFCGYPEETVRAVSDPVGGLPSTSRFFPTIADVKAALEAVETPKRVKLAAENRIRDTQRLISAPKAEATPEERERAVARWEAQREEMRGREKKSAEQVEAEAKAELRRLWHARNAPVNIGPALSRTLAAMKAERE
jgi:hypothetical protein